MSQIFFIPHGGGPLPLLGDPGYARLAEMLRSLNGAVAKAKAIIVVTAHWETEQPTLTSSANPGMLYDYFGFPDAAYRIDYPAPGAPALAETVAQALGAEGFDVALDQERGFDHGVFVPMALIHPEASIPILQMSILASLDPMRHIMVGRALAGILSDDIVLIGSGFSFHNLKALTRRLDQDETRQGVALATDFHTWLDNIVCNPEMSAGNRITELVNWSSAPGARFCQPREEHLLPLHVCIGAAAAAGMSATQIFAEPVKGYQTSGYSWV